MHPLFIVPFLGLLLVLALQLYYPFPEGGWMWPDKRLPLDALILFNAFLLTRIVTRARAHLFPLLVLSLTGASYAHAAIEKLRLGPYLGSWLSNHNLALLWYVSRLQRDGTGLYSRRNALLVMLVVAGTRLYFYNVDYAWFDSRVSNFFVMRGIGASGREYRLEPRFFSPYDLIVQQSRFYYLTERPVLAGTYGTTHDFALLRDLEAARVEDLPRLRAEHGRKWTNAGWAHAFRGFVQRFTANAQERGSKRIWLNGLAPPYHFQTTLAPNAYDFQEPLVRVEVDFEEHFFDGRKIVPTAKETVMVIPLPQALPAPAQAAKK